MTHAPSEWGGRPVWAEIDLDALQSNVRLLVSRAAPARLYAVVKANAYGHGAVAVGRAALGAGAAGLAVVCVDEGEELRRAGIEAPVLVVGHTVPSDAERVVALGLRPTVGALALVEALSAAAARRGSTVSIHLELETGLTRHGLRPDELVALAEQARTLPGIVVEGLFTHFAAAEEGDQRFTRKQFDLLRETSKRLPWIPERHCAASASVLTDGELSLEAVRTGLSMYGYRPAPWCGTAGMTPVLSLRSRIARLLDVERGTTVGYGRTWAAARPSRIALVMCGYADGYRRAFGNRAHVIVHGRRAPVVGRVAMDMCMVDVTAIPGDVRVGEVVTLLGRDGEERVDADELATLADTISWEILAGVTARVPRLYLRDGRVEAVTTLNQRVPVPPEKLRG